MSEEFVRLYDRYLGYFAGVSDEALGKAVRAALQYHAFGKEDSELIGNAGMVYDILVEDINRVEAFGDD